MVYSDKTLSWLHLKPKTFRSSSSPSARFDHMGRKRLVSCTQSVLSSSRWLCPDSYALTVASHGSHTGPQHSLSHSVLFPDPFAVFRLWGVFFLSSFSPSLFKTRASVPPCPRSERSPSWNSFCFFLLFVQRWVCLFGSMSLLNCCPRASPP